MAKRTTALLLFLLVLPARGFAADVPLTAAAWTPFLGSGTLSNTTEDVPGLGGVEVLRAQTAAGLNYGFVQAGYTSLAYTGRYVRAVLKSPGSFVFYVRVRGTNGLDYYLTYASYLQPVAVGAGNYLNFTLAADYPARYNQYQTYTFDVQADLARLVPGVTPQRIRWFAARGPLTLAKLEVLSTVEYLAGDDDGDLLTGAAEDALGTSPFLFDTDGDGVADGLEAGHACGDPLVAAGAAALDADPDADGIPTRTELFLGSDCAAAGVARLPAAHGWAPYYPTAAFPSGAALTAAADGEIALQHTAANALAFGVWNPDPKGRFRLPVDLQAAHLDVRFAVKSAEPFYLYVRLQATNGQSYYVTYQPGGGAPSYGNGYAVIPLGTLGHAFSGEAYTEIVRNLGQDLAAVLPGVTAAKVRWVALRGRGAFKPLAFVVPQPEAPQLSGVYPAQATGGTLITLTGARFGSSQGQLTLGGRTVTVLSWSETQVTFTLPATAGPGVKVVEVETAGDTRSNFALLAVLPSLMPAADGRAYLAAPGGTVVFTGANLGDGEGAGDALLIGGLPAPGQGWSQQAVTFAVPSGMSGLRTVQIQAAGFTTELRELDVRPGAVATYLVAEPGETLDLTGTGFGASPGTLYVGEAAATVLAWEDTRLSFVVPASLAPATYAVDVDAGGVRTTVAALEVLPQKPIIDSWEPLQPVIGEVVTFHGRNFGAAQGTGSVWVANQRAAIVAWSNTRIDAIVPRVYGNWSRAVVVAGKSSYLIVGRTYTTTPRDGTTIRNYQLLLPPGVITSMQMAFAFDRPVTENAIIWSPSSNGLSFATANAPMPATALFDRGVPMPPPYRLRAWHGKNPVGYWQISVYNAASLNLRSWKILVQGTGATGYQSEVISLQLKPRIDRVIAHDAGWVLYGAGFVSDINERAQYAYFDGSNLGFVTSLSNEVASTSVYGLSAGPHTVSVNLAGLSSPPASFTIASDPTLFSAAPSPVTVGAKLHADGIYLGAYPATIRLSGVTMPVEAWSQMAVDAIVPDDVTAGTRMLRVDFRFDQPQGPLTYESVAVRVGGANVSSQVYVDGAPGVVSSIQVTPRLTHPNYADLTLRLVRFPPSVVLQANQASDPNTTYPTRTPSAGSLALFQGKPGFGLWELDIGDVTSFRGTLYGWTLTLSTAPAPDETYQYTFSPYEIDPTIQVPRGGPVGDVEVALNLTHSDARIDALDIALEHPDGTTVVLQQGVNVTGRSTLATTYPTLTLPAGSLAAFTGKPSLGVWRLRISDPFYGAGSWTLNSFSLKLPGTTTTPLSTNELPVIVLPLVRSISPPAVSAGMPITLMGGGFGNAGDMGTVTIDGAPVTVSRWSMREIELLVPGGLAPGPHPVIVTAGGQPAAPVMLQVMP